MWTDVSSLPAARSTCRPMDNQSQLESRLEPEGASDMQIQKQPSLGVFFQGKSVSLESTRCRQSI